MKPPGRPFDLLVFPSPFWKKEMATHSSTLAWKIPWTEEAGRLQSMGLRRVRHDWATSLSLFTLMHWGRKWQPTPVFLPGESQGQGSLVVCCLWGLTGLDTRGAWWSAVYGVSQGWTRLKRLSSSSSSSSSLFWLNFYSTQNSALGFRIQCICCIVLLVWLMTGAMSYPFTVPFHGVQLSAQHVKLQSTRA